MEVEGEEEGVAEPSPDEASFVANVAGSASCGELLLQQPLESWLRGLARAHTRVSLGSPVRGAARVSAPSEGFVGHRQVVGPEFVVPARRRALRAAARAAERTSRVPVRDAARRL